MRIHIPNSAFLQNIQGFLSGIDTADPDALEVTFHDRWVAVHPFVLATVSAAARSVLARGGSVTGRVPQVASLPYLVRMGLFDQLGIEVPVHLHEHEPAGRFIPLTSVTTNDQLSAFLVDMVPLLHASPTEVEPIKYAISELVRNALEHARSPIGAVVCAQYWPETKRLALGVADMGRGVQASMAQSHVVRTPLEAIDKALRPGVTGTSARFGGTEYNAGAGLFFVKSIARASRNYFVIYSGDAVFKLLRGRERDVPVISADPHLDPSRWIEGLGTWPGTVVGLDVTVSGGRTFSDLLGQIREAYHLEVRAAKKEAYRRPRFT